MGRRCTSACGITTVLCKRAAVTLRRCLAALSIDVLCPPCRRYEIQRGRLSQGYGDSEFKGYFNFGSRYIDLPEITTFEPWMNCTSGFWLYNKTSGTDVWLPGTCEADIICNIKTKSEGQACSRTSACVNTGN